MLSVIFAIFILLPHEHERLSPFSSLFQFLSSDFIAFIIGFLLPWLVLLLDILNQIPSLISVSACSLLVCRKLLIFASRFCFFILG